ATEVAPALEVLLFWPFGVAERSQFWGKLYSFILSEGGNDVEIDGGRWDVYTVKVKARNKSSNEKENSEEESEHKGAANVKVEENDGIGLCGVISSTRSSPGVLLRFALSLPASKQANTCSHRSPPPHTPTSLALLWVYVYASTCQEV
ncbi:hypothetical protein C3L33_13386, partial [Rhododendron williamsianum]